MRWAQKLNPDIAFENAPDVRPMGITIHISKRDVRNYRRDHPECKSHRQGLKTLIEEARWQVAGAIGRGMMDKGAIHFDIDKTLYVADVSGIAYLYAEGSALTEGKKHSE